MIFAAFKWLALARGAWKGLTYRPEPLTLANFDQMLRDIYSGPIVELLNRPMEPWMFGPTMADA